MIRISALLSVALAASSMLVAPASAQPSDLPIPAAKTGDFPAGIGVRKTADGPVYVDAKGHTLYGLDMRTVHRWTTEPAMYCKDRCDAAWQPLLAPAGSKPNIGSDKGFSELLRRGLAGGAARGQQQQRPRGNSEEASTVLEDGTVFWTNPQKAPDWTVTEGPQGPQYVYKGWHLVYTRAGEKPGSTGYDGADDFTWNTLKFIPSTPEVTAPAQIAPVVVGKAYALADNHGNLLYTGTCKTECAGWTPLAGGLANRGTGDWSITRSGDVAQWTWRGKPVFVSQGDAIENIPADGEVLRP